MVEHFHEVTFPQDRIERDVGVKIDVPLTPEGNVTVTPINEEYTVPSGQYYVEIFSKMEVPTPIDDEYLPEGDNSFGFGLNIDEWVNYKKLSFVRDFPPKEKLPLQFLICPLCPKKMESTLWFLHPVETSTS